MALVKRWQGFDADRQFIGLFRSPAAAKRGGAKLWVRIVCEREECP